jgi:hypothetical protein
MVRNLGSCPNFWCSALGQILIRTDMFLLFPYYCSLYSNFCSYFSEVITLVLVIFFVVVCIDEHGRLPPLLPR